MGWWLFSWLGRWLGGGDRLGEGIRSAYQRLSIYDCLWGCYGMVTVLSRGDHWPISKGRGAHGKVDGPVVLFGAMRTTHIALSSLNLFGPQSPRMFESDPSS